MSDRVWWKCTCGVEWRAILKDDAGSMDFPCFCGKMHRVIGTITKLEYLPVGSVEWRLLPRSSYLNSN